MSTPKALTLAALSKTGSIACGLERFIEHSGAHGDRFNFTDALAAHLHHKVILVQTTSLAKPQKAHDQVVEHPGGCEVAAHWRVFEV